MGVARQLEQTDGQLAKPKTMTFGSGYCGFLLSK
jgi:hypothetical protein